MKALRENMTVEYHDQLLNATPGKLLEVIGVQPDDCPQDIAGLTLLVVNLLTRQHRLDVRNDELTGALKALDGHVYSVLAKRCDDLATRLDNQASNMDDLAHDLGHKARLINTLEKKLAIVIQHKGFAEDKLAKMEAATARSSGRIDALADLVPRLEGRMARNEARTDAAIDRSADNREDLKAHTTKLATLVTRGLNSAKLHNNSRERVISLENNLTNVKARCANLETNLAETSQATENHTGRLVKIEWKVSQHSNQVTQLESATGRSSGRIDALETITHSHAPGGE